MTNNAIIGSQQDVIDYYLNNQFSTVSKIIITSDSFLNGITSNASIRERILEFLNSNNDEENTSNNKQQFHDFLENLETTNEFYKSIQEQTKSLGKEVDIALKDYNFMSSISNTRYTITLRTSQGAYSKYFVEKNSLIGSMKQLFESYIMDVRNPQEWELFQFECYCSEDIYKKVYVKKEQNQLLLYAIYGCDPQYSFNIVGGGEMYHSIDEKFFFYQNKQEIAYLRQYGNLDKREINKQQRVLGSSELKSINEATKQIDNVILELYLTQKGEVRILNTTSNQHPLGTASQKGCVIFKSSKQYNKISLITPKECGDLETTNPQYLLVKNEYELHQVLYQIQNLPIDGLVFTFNFYHPLLELIAEKKDIDVIYYDEPLQRSMEVSINWEEFSIDGATSKGNNNPFSSILSSENKEKDELLEKLKNVDLSTKKDEDETQNYQEIEQLTQSMTASPNSSNKKMANSNTFSNTPASTSSTNEKKSAIGMLADAALNQGPAQSQGASNNNEESSQQNNSQDNSSQEFNHYQQGVSNEENYSQGEFSNDFLNSNQTQEQSTHNSAQKVEDIFSTNQNQEKKEFKEQQNQETLSNSLEQYVNVLATRVYTPPQIPSHGHIVDSSSLSEISHESDIVLVVSQYEEITNPSVTYALPITSGIHTQAYSLLSSPYDFFLLQNNSQSSKPLLNLTVIENEIKDSLLEQIANNYSQFSLIISKQDIPLLENMIPSIELIYIKDVNDQQELQFCRDKVLSFEKKILLNSLSRS